MTFETTNVCTIIYKLNNIVLRIDTHTHTHTQNHFKKWQAKLDLVVPILCPKTIPKGNIEEFFFGYNAEEEFKS